MKKLNTKGFSVVEGLLIGVIVLLVVGVGYYVYNSQKNINKSLDTAVKSQNEPKKSEKKNSATTNSQPVPTNLTKYEDDYISFSYPSDWKVKKQSTFTDSYGAYSIDLTAPVDSTIKASDASLTKLYLQASILIAKNNRFGTGGTTCRENCTVYHIDRVSPQSPTSTGSLVISDWASMNYPQVVEYTKSDVIVGTKTYALGLPLTGSYYARINGNYMSGTMSFVKLANETDFQNSIAYKQLKDMVPTITFKTTKLP